MKPRRHQHGFTLIEIMLAVALLALLLMILASSFAAVAHSKVHAENRMAADQAGRNIIWQLSKELRGTVQTQFEPSRVLLIGIGRKQGGYTMDTISFSTLDAGHRRSLSSFGSEDTITYTSTPTPGYPGWSSLVRTAHSSLLNSNTADRDIPVVLSDNVLGLHLRYFDGTRWLEAWNSASAATGGALPLAVSIELVMATPNGGPVSFSTQVTLPMATTAQ